MSREDRNVIGYIVAFVSEFAKRFGLRSREAYAYIKRFRGLDHLEEHYGVLHTLSFDDSVTAVAQVCINNGGELR